MKRKLAFILILFFLACLVFCGCDMEENSTWGVQISPWGTQNTQNNDGTNAVKTYKIYVCGAVENEGYVEVEEGETYFDAIVKAGRLSCSVIPNNANTLVDGSQNIILVRYLEDGVACDCYNVNGAYTALGVSLKGLSDEIVSKIAEYFETHDKISNKTELLEILGEEDFANYHYKLYVAEADYEEAH